MKIPQKQKFDKYLGYSLIIVLIPITRLLGILLKRSHTLSPPPQNILFIKLLGLGSLISASNSINAIKKKYPKARLILITDPNIANGISYFNLFDEIWPVTSRNIYSTINDALKYLYKSWTLKRLWVVDLEVYSKLTTIYSLLTFAINRFGFQLSPVLFRKFLNTHNVIFDQSIFLEDNYLNMSREVTGEKYTPDPLLIVRKKEHLKPYIVVNNTCSDLALSRKLPDSTFFQICNWILENTHYKIAFLGAPSDKENINKFIESNPSLSERKERLLNIAGISDFKYYYNFISENGACLITIDSAPLHIAKKLGVPTLSIWGPTDPDNYLKIYPGEENRHLVHYLRHSCSPCVHRHNTLPCKGDNICMKEIQAEEIINKLNLMLSNLALASKD